MENCFGFAVRLKFTFFQAVSLERFLFYSNFQILSNHNGFSFFARDDQYFKLIKDSHVFEFTNFPFKTKYNTVVYSVNSNYLSSRGKQEKKLLKQFFD